MQKSKYLTICILILLFVYFLFSQFYLRTLGNIYTYLINPLFFIAIAVALKILMQSPYKTDKYKKTITFYIWVTMIAYCSIYLLSGIFLTYGANPYANSFKGLILNLYSTGLIAISLEYVRYKLINNVFKKDKRIIFILIVIIFTLKDFPYSSLINSLNIYFVFKVLFATVVPTIIKNALLTYITMYTDYKPAVLYQLLSYLILWVPPVLPNAPWVFYSIIDILFPVILLLYCMYEISSKDKLHIYKVSNPMEPRGLVPMTASIVLVIWFALGIFPIKPLGIASGSMQPTLYVGDLVLIKKCNSNSVKVNDIIEYQRKDFSVIHRVIEKYQKDGETFFITKGDNNSNKDGEPISEQRLKGKVIFRIPYLALPTIWINALSGRQNYVDVETGN